MTGHGLGHVQQVQVNQQVDKDSHYFMFMPPGEAPEYPPPPPSSPPEGKGSSLEQGSTSAMADMNGRGDLFTDLPAVERDSATSKMPPAAKQLVVTLPSKVRIVLKPHETGHLIDAVHSLYEDRILPDEKTLKARLKLKFEPGRAKIILPHLIPLYSKVKGMKVVTDDENVGGGPAVFLKEEPANFAGFVDPCSNADPYPDAVWQQFERYLQTLLYGRFNSRSADASDAALKAGGSATEAGAGVVTFHRGRYGLATDLYDRKLSFFKGMALGEVCHMVELAIQRALLHYENNLLLPAQACGKHHNAIYGIPTASAANQRAPPSASYVQTIGELQALLIDLLTLFPDGFNLSTLKTKIKMYYNKRLSETVFFETKLLTLVQSPTLSAIARIVKLQGNCGYLCQPAFDVPAPPRNSPQHHDRPQASRTNFDCHYGHRAGCGSGGSTIAGDAHYGGSGFSNWREQRGGSGSNYSTTPQWNPSRSSFPLHQGRRAHPACGYDISTAGKGKGKGKGHNGAAGYHDRGVCAGRFDCHAGTFV